MQILNYDRGARSQRGLGHETEVFALPSIYAAHMPKQFARPKYSDAAFVIEGMYPVLWILTSECLSALWLPWTPSGTSC